MGNAQFELPPNVRQQWIEYLDGNRQLFKNKITNEVFQLMVLSTTNPNNPISSFIQRSIYALPKTPKVIILNDQSGELFILVQQYESSLAREIPKICIFIDLLQFIKNIAIVIHSLYRKYGPFKITETMIGVDKNLEVMAWINQSKEKNQVQFTYESKVRVEHLMIQNLIRLIQQYTYFNGYLECLLKENNFSAFITAISQLINSKKIEIMKGQVQRPKTRTTRLLTPEYPHQLKKELSSKGINFNESPTNLKKRPSIPNFIKVIKQKKIHLLDSINHKRTFTREDGDVNKNIKIIKKKQISDYSNQLSQVRSVKDSPMKAKECHFSHSNLSKLSKNPSNTETSEQLTSSEDSIARIIKRRDFNGKNKNKTCFQAPLSQTHGGSTKNIAQKTQSFLFLSSHKSPQKINLVNLCKNTTQSKYFQTSKEQKSIIKQSEQQNMRLSKMIQEQLDGFFTPPCQSHPPLWVQVVQNDDLREQFKRIINF